MFGDVTRDDVFRIETRRLWLRWPRAADAAAITAYASLHDVARMTAAIPHPYPADGAAQFVARVCASNASGESLHLAITEKHGPRALAGVISIEAGGPALARIGFALSPQHWGKGYATEAAQAMIAAVFQLTGVKAVASSVFAGNPASTRVHAKCGFVSLGHAEMEAPARGRVVTVEQFTLSRRLWRAERSGADTCQLAGCEAQA